MSRQIERLVIPGERGIAVGTRDNGKTFFLTEMDAYSGQDWALRAILALSRSGAILPPEAVRRGWPALVSFGFSALLGASHADIRPLLDELLTHVRYSKQPDNAKWPKQTIEAGSNCVVEEVATFLEIYKAMWTLHTGFSLPGSGQTMGSASSPGDPIL